MKEYNPYEWHGYTLELFPEVKECKWVEARLIEEVGAGYKIEVYFNYNWVNITINYLIPHSKILFNWGGVIKAPHSFYILGKLYLAYQRQLKKELEDGKDGIWDKWPYI